MIERGEGAAIDGPFDDKAGLVVGVIVPGKQDLRPSLKYCGQSVGVAGAVTDTWARVEVPVTVRVE